jgi:hypothetical protein
MNAQIIIVSYNVYNNFRVQLALTFQLHMLCLFKYSFITLFNTILFYVHLTRSMLCE